MSTNPASVPALSELAVTSDPAPPQTHRWAALTGRHRTSETIETNPLFTGTATVTQQAPERTALAQVRHQAENPVPQNTLWRAAGKIRELAADRGLTDPREAFPEWMDTLDTSEQAQFSTASAQHQLQDALADFHNGLGPLAQYWRQEDITDLHLAGTRLIAERNGQKEEQDPWWADDQELISWCSNLAALHGQTWSETTPVLQLSIDGRMRLVAMAWIAKEPRIVIRFHRHTKATLDDLVHLNTLTPEAAKFLATAVQKRRSIIVSGDQGAGKTTLLRALIGQFDLNDAIGVLETDFELFVDGIQKWRVPPLQTRTRDGGTERLANGQRVGHISMEENSWPMLRMSLQRTVVGEIRGPEIMSLITTMQTGAGGLATIHARSADDTVQRLITAVLQAGYTLDFASRAIASSIHYIVHIAVIGNQRQISKIISVQPGENGAPATDTIFERNQHGELIQQTVSSVEREHRS